MATLATILAFSRQQAQTDNNGLTDAKGIVFANEALVDFHRRLVKHGVDASQIQETYIPTITAPSSGNGSTFAYPSDCLALKTIEVNYTDTNVNNYITATQVDVSNLSGQNSFSWLRSYQSTQIPKFDDRGDWYEIFPAFTANNNLTNAIRLFYYLKPTLYTATSDTVAYPESQDNATLGWRIAAMYLYSLGNIEQGDAFNMKYEERVKEYITTLGRGSQQPIQAVPIQDSGWSY
jgi:hypothetical protein